MRSPKDVLALGQEIVRELELDNRGTVLDRWLAHHLAELMSEADCEAGSKKAEAEQKAVDLILKLWMHRRALPEPADPLGGYRDAIAVLGRLMPEANPWRRFRRGDTFEGLLNELFATMSRVVLGGVILTQLKRTRQITPAESDALEAEEAYMSEVLEHWEPFFGLPPEEPKIDIVFTDPDFAEATEDQDESLESRHEDLTLEDQSVGSESSIHTAIVSNLERMQEDLSKLLNQWRSAAASASDAEKTEPGKAGRDN